MLIPFTGFGIDHIARGRLELLEERLTDALAVREELLLVDVVLEGLADLATLAIGDHVVSRRELLAAIGGDRGGPRGARSKRVTTTRLRLQASVGPYEILGRLHAPPGASLADRLLDAGPLVPLTDATIAYVIGGILEVRDAPVIYVNRDLSSWSRPEPVTSLFVRLAPRALR